MDLLRVTKRVTALLLLANLNVHAQTTRSVSLRIDPVFNGEKLVLETKKYLSPFNDTLQIERFRFYISSLQLVFKDGSVYTEKDSYHLVDAEDENGLKFTLGQVPAGKITTIRFNIGVDSLMSVSGAMDGALDPRNGMYWAWNSGYINAKLEGRSRSCKTHQNRFEFHIGGYSFPQNALRQVQLNLDENMEDKSILLAADAKIWFNGVSLAQLPGIMIPGKEAMRMADNYSRMFSVVSK